MYLKFYNLREPPFALTSDERFYFQSSAHAEALASMAYAVGQRKGMVLVTGEVGAGKTFLGNMLARQLGSHCETVHLSHPPDSGKQLRRHIAEELGVRLAPEADKMAVVKELQHKLTKLLRRGRLVTLILDESQDMPDDALEEVRLLWNFEHDGQRLMQIVLIAQPEMRRRLQHPRWDSLQQRIILSCHLGPLSEKDTQAYIMHRRRVARRDDCTLQFTVEAIKAVYAATRGIPRMINVVCDNALLVGYAQSKTLITRAIVNEVLREMTSWGIRPASASVTEEEPPDAGVYVPHQEQKQQTTVEPQMNTDELR